MFWSAFHLHLGHLDKAWVWQFLLRRLQGQDEVTVWKKKGRVNRKEGVLRSLSELLFFYKGSMMKSFIMA